MAFLHPHRPGVQGSVPCLLGRTSRLVLLVQCVINCLLGNINFTQDATASMRFQPFRLLRARRAAVVASAAAATTHQETRRLSSIPQKKHGESSPRQKRGNDEERQAVKERERLLGRKHLEAGEEPRKREKERGHSKKGDKEAKHGATRHQKGDKEKKREHGTKGKCDSKRKQDEQVKEKKEKVGTSKAPPRDTKFTYDEERKKKGGKYGALASTAATVSKEKKVKGAQMSDVFGAPAPLPAKGKKAKPDGVLKTLSKEEHKASITLRAPTDATSVEHETGGATASTLAFVGTKNRKGTVSRLQQDLDALCVNHFHRICKSQEGQSSHCKARTAVARLDSTCSDTEAGWRCYDGRVAETEELGLRCTDECGGAVRCTGKLDRKTILTSEQLPELRNFLHRRKWIYCSSFQYAANALCNFKKTSNVARYDPHRARWMCLDPVDIALDSTGYCADNCGGTIPCAGGITPGDVPARTVYIVQKDNIVEAFAALQPCKGPDEVCLATKMNPPKCVTSSSPGVELKLSRQQAAMNRLCQREVDNLCRARKWTAYCYGMWLARKVPTTDLSATSRGTGLACYPRDALNFNEVSGCFDGCSIEVPCPGRPSSSSVPHVLVSGLLDILKNPFYCSPYQDAGNKFCEKRKGLGSVARQHNVTREWQCFNHRELPPKGWTGCADNCGSFTTCASASVDADPTVLEDQILERAIRGTPAPCLSGEECEPTALNPPYCSQTRPNPQPLLPSPEELQKELGCTADGAGGAFLAEQKFYGPASHLSTIASLRARLSANTA